MGAFDVVQPVKKRVVESERRESVRLLLAQITLLGGPFGGRSQPGKSRKNTG